MPCDSVEHRMMMMIAIDQIDHIRRHSQLHIIKERKILKSQHLNKAANKDPLNFFAHIE